MVLLAGLALVRSLDFLVARGVPVWGAIILGLLFAAVIMAISAWLIERFVLGPLVNQDGLTLFMSTIGATFILEGAADDLRLGRLSAARLFPPTTVPVRGLFPGGIWSTSSTCGALHRRHSGGGLAIFFQRTKTGRALRAVADDHAAAQSVGIPISWICLLCGSWRAWWRWWRPRFGAPSSACSSPSRSWRLRRCPCSSSAASPGAGAIVGGLIVGAGEKSPSLSRPLHRRRHRVLVCLRAGAHRAVRTAAGAVRRAHHRADLANGRMANSEW